MQFMISPKPALALVACATFLAACDDPQSLRAALPTVNDTYTVFALSGTPAVLPSAINTFVRTVTRVDGNANFDVALDINVAGKVIFYPVQKVVASPSSARRVGLRRVDGPFDAVTLAPSGTYADSVIVASPGDVIVVQSRRNGSNDVCQFEIAPFIYAKLMVDSVTSSNRSITVQAVLDPNCGFRSFEPGIPTR